MKPFYVPSFLLSRSDDEVPVARIETHWQEGDRVSETKDIWRGSNWYSIFCAALRENDTTQSLPWIGCAQRAIQDRVAELNVIAAENLNEMQALRESLDHLRLLLDESNKSQPTSWD